MPQTKEERLEYKRQWRINNKEKIAEYNKQYRIDNAEIKRQYRIKNKEKIAENNKQYRIDNAEHVKQYRQENREKVAEYNKQYYQENKEKLAEKKIEYNKQYYQTDQCKKVNRIHRWKTKGLVDSDNDNYESIYDYYINTTQCEYCDVVLTEDKIATPTRKCMDHSHTTGLFRNILCLTCNLQRGEDNF